MRKRHTPEQIVEKVRQVEAALASGESLPDIAKAHGVAETTIQRWRNQYGGMTTPEVKRLRELERENARLKKLVADQALDIDMLKEVAKGNF